MDSEVALVGAGFSLEELDNATQRHHDLWLLSVYKARLEAMRSQALAVSAGVGSLFSKNGMAAISDSLDGTLGKFERFQHARVRGSGRREAAEFQQGAPRAPGSWDGADLHPDHPVHRQTRGSRLQAALRGERPNDEEVAAIQRDIQKLDAAMTKLTGRRTRNPLAYS